MDLSKKSRRSPNSNFYLFNAFNRYSKVQAYLNKLSYSNIAIIFSRVTRLQCNIWFRSCSSINLRINLRILTQLFGVIQVRSSADAFIWIYTGLFYSFRTIPVWYTSVTSFTRPSSFTNTTIFRIVSYTFSVNTFLPEKKIISTLQYAFNFLLKVN